MSDPLHQPLAGHAPHSDAPYHQQVPHGYAPPPQGYGQPAGYAPPQGQQQYYPPQSQAHLPPHHHMPPHVMPQGQPGQIAAVHVPVYAANVGPCAAGGGHSIREEFTACGLVLGILCFPIGLICCLTMKDRTCLRCGMRFD